MKLSASKIDCFFSCKRLFKFRYITKPIPVPESKYFLIGNVAHKTLENFHKKIVNEDKSNWKDIIRNCFIDSVKSYNLLGKMKYLDISKEDTYKLRDMMKKYVENLNKAPNWQSIEQFFNINIDGIQINGKADRVDLEDNNLIIVDYKTSSKTFTQKEAFESVQLPIYGLWLQEKNQPMFGKYIWLKFLGTNKSEQIFEITDSLMNNAIGKCKYMLNELNSNCKFEKNLSYKYCRMCEYKSVCIQE